MHFPRPCGAGRHIGRSSAEDGDHQKYVESLRGGRIMHFAAAPTRSTHTHTHTRNTHKYIYIYIYKYTHMEGPYRADSMAVLIVMSLGLSCRPDMGPKTEQ
jgi:hypothetical protein